MKNAIIKTVIVLYLSVYILTDITQEGICASTEQFLAEQTTEHLEQSLQ